jgi:antitoxin HigA-1
VEIVDYPLSTSIVSKKLAIVASLPPLHPGEVLREEFLEPMGLTPDAVAKACGVPRTRIERIAREEIGISADTALRLGRFFGIEPEFWLNLQTRHDLERLRLGPTRHVATANQPSTSS